MMNVLKLVLKYIILMCIRQTMYVAGTVPSTTTNTMTTTAAAYSTGPTTSRLLATYECPNGWVKAIDYCYFFSQTFAPFPDAELECNRMSAHLASIHSLAENTYIINS